LFVGACGVAALDAKPRQAAGFASPKASKKVSNIYNKSLYVFSFLNS
jgi:hypothetical protein